MYVHKKCLGEWLIFQGNECVICREKCYDDYDQHNMICTANSLKNHIRNGKIEYSIEFKELIEDKTKMNGDYSIPVFNIELKSKSDHLEIDLTNNDSQNDSNVDSDNQITLIQKVIGLIGITIITLACIFLT